MHLSQNTRIINVTGTDFTVDNGSFTTAEIDTLGYDYLTIIAAFGNVPANVAALTITESNTAGSGHGNVTGLIVGTSANTDGTTSVLPTAAAGDGRVIVFEIDLRGRRRYIDTTLTAGNGAGTVTEACVIAILSRAEDAPVTATERGVNDILRV